MPGQVQGLEAIVSEATHRAASNDANCLRMCWLICCVCVVCARFDAVSFGKVSRAMNRKPGPYDSWFRQHEQNCGGYFVKVKGPTEAEMKAERKEKDRKKRAEKKADRDREEKREERKDDEKNGLRQTDLRDSIPSTKKTRKRTLKKDDEQKDEQEQPDSDGDQQEGESQQTNDAARGSGQGKGLVKQRKRRKKLPGKGHVLGTGAEVGARTKRRKEGGGKNQHDQDTGQAREALVDDRSSSSQPSIPSSSLPAMSPPTQTASISIPFIPVPPDSSFLLPTSSTAITPQLPVVPSSSAVVVRSPARSAALSSSSATRPRATNVFDLMAARGDRRKVDQLINKTKQHVA